jgi:hypothetical protein
MLSLKVSTETKVVLDALSAIEQVSVAEAVERAVRAYVEKLPEADQALVRGIQARAMGSTGSESRPARVEREADVEYEFTRLCFMREKIEPLGDDQVFRVITPMGIFEMSKGEFYRDFPNVVHSRSYQERGIYHYPVVPARALKYKV